MAIDQLSRFIVWRPATHLGQRIPVERILAAFPTVDVIRADDPDSAIVLTDEETAQTLRNKLQDCVIEPDVRHRLAR